MKNYKLILAAIFALAWLASCDKNENEPEVSLEKATISAKWIGTSSGEYKSFEFNESGNYIIVKNSTTKSLNDQIILFGNYEIFDNSTIVLSDFGTLTVSGINENSISFSIQLTSNPEIEIVIQASKHEEMGNSAKTELLCQSWELVSLDGEAMTNCIVLFSKAGTYLVNAVVDVEKKSGLGTWTWCNPEESKLAFTIGNEPDCEGNQIIKDIQLTSDSFIGTDMENGEPMEMIMKPVSSKKSDNLSVNNIELSLNKARMAPLARFRLEAP
jgi:hypothetical protein